MSKRHYLSFLLPLACASQLAYSAQNDVQDNVEAPRWTSLTSDQHNKSNQSLYSFSYIGNDPQPAEEPSSEYERVVSIKDPLKTPCENRYLDSESIVAVDTPEITQGNVQAPLNVSGAQTTANVQTPFKGSQEGPVINFNNVNITEFLRFVSRLTGKNFIFDPQELQFSVTIISETPATLEDVMAALMQNLRIHNFLLIEEGNSFVIYSNTAIKAPGDLAYRDDSGQLRPDIATQVFAISNVTPGSLASVLRAMTTSDAIVQTIDETNSIVVTDIAGNLKKIEQLIKRLDLPSTGLEIGQYVALNNSPAALISVASKILTPLAGDKTLIFVPYQIANSIFIVSTPFLVEKSLSVMQALDMNIGISGTLNLDALKFDATQAEKLRLEKGAEEQKQKTTPIPLTQEEVDLLTDREKMSILTSKGYKPDEVSRLSAQQVSRILREKGLSQLERETILGQKSSLYESELPLGQAESTQFLIHKLQYRKADVVTKALQAIAESLSGGAQQQTGRSTEPPQSDLVVTLLSVQTIDETNSIVFTGTRKTLQKVKELVSQVDIPVRQVFIEVLVLDTTVAESLNFGVEWGVKLQRKNFAGETGLITNPSNVAGPLQLISFPDATTVGSSTAGGTTTPIPPIGSTQLMPGIPLTEGFSVNGIGRKITHHGTRLWGTAALINLLRSDDNARLIINPKIVVEHNQPAEIFVGAQVPIKGQSIVNSTANNATNTVSTNYVTQNVGVNLKVTPLISSGDMVTMIIEQEVSTADPTQVNAQGQNNAPPATIRQLTSKTRVHVPSNYFLVMSGMLQTNTTVKATKFPILGSLPIIGFFFQNTQDTVSQRNVILYLRPKIIDTVIDIEEITRKEETKYNQNSEITNGFQGNMNDLKKILNF